MIKAFIPDEEVSLDTLKIRLSAARTCLAQKTVPKKFASGLLVSDEWFELAFSRRVYELENLIVLRVGVPGDIYLVKRKLHVVEHWKVPARSPSEAIERVDNGGGTLDWTEKWPRNVEAVLEGSVPEG